MIVEAIRHFLSPCPARLKRLGVLYDLIALEARAQRCAQAWQPHREACAEVILEAADRVPHRASCVVLGSGLLLEVPLEALAERFEQVTLVDLWHQGAVRRRAAPLGGRVHLETCDLSGTFGDGETALEQLVVAGILPKPVVGLLPGAEADFVVSANCLSQLPLIPLRLAWNAARFTPDTLRTWGAALQMAHLAALAEMPGRKLLIADVERRRLRAGTTEELRREPLLPGVSLPSLNHKREWLWSLAPAPEEERGIDVVSQVITGELG